MASVVYTSYGSNLKRKITNNIGIISGGIEVWVERYDDNSLKLRTTAHCSYDRDAGYTWFAIPIYVTVEVWTSDGGYFNTGRITIKGVQPESYWGDLTQTNEWWIGSSSSGNVTVRATYDNDDTSDKEKPYIVEISNQSYPRPADQPPNINYDTDSPVSNALLDRDIPFRIYYTRNTAIASNPGSIVVDYYIHNSGWRALGYNNEAGTIDLVPSGWGVPDGIAFDTGLRRYNPNSNPTHGPNGDRGVTRNFRTYTYPNITGFITQYNPVNGNKVCPFTWNDWNGNWSEQSLVYMSVNKGPFISMGSGHPTSGSMMLGNQYGLSYGGNTCYVPFTKDNEDIEVTLRRDHASVGEASRVLGRYRVEKSIKMKVRYTPTEKIVNFYPNPPGTLNTVPTEQGSLSMKWDYPDKETDVNKGQNGIVTRYDINFINTKNGSIITETTTTKSFNFDITKLTPTVFYDLVIWAVFDNGLTGSSRIYSRGPAFEIKNYIKRVSRLDKPVIEYPLNNSQWYGLTFRVAFPLPVDPDYKYLTPDVQNNYLYEDIEVSVNGIVKSIKTNPEAFSRLPIELSYKGKTVFNPVLANFGLSSSISSYSVRIRVKKKYIDPSLEFVWSYWSDTINITNRVRPTLSTPQGSIIMSSHIKLVDTETTTVTSAYFPTPMAITDYYKQIDREEYNILYAKIFKIVNFIDTYGVYNINRQNVKFKDIDEFKAQIVQINYNLPQNYLQLVLTTLLGICS